jgi:HEAT repeat protein
MFERVKLAGKTVRAENNQLTTNPIMTENKKYISDLIFEKVKALDSEHNQNNRSEKTFEIINDIKNLHENDLILLMKHENEIIRSFAARAFVDNSLELPVSKLEDLLKNDNENLRDAAVMALCYMNSSNVLDLLDQATNDNLNSIKLKAISGIADIAAEQSDIRAKEILKKFLDDKNSAIREYATDEFSFLN